MTKTTHQLYLLLPLVVIVWWTLSFGFNKNKGSYQAVTDQTSITGANVSVNTKGNTHLKGAVVAGSKSTDITTATLTTEDIENKATYQSMSGGVSYSSITTDKDKSTVANNQSNQKEEQKSKGITPDIGLPQDVEKSATTHTAILRSTAPETLKRDKIKLKGEHSSIYWHVKIQSF